MLCERVQIPGGGTAIVCSDRRRRRCAFCNEWSTKLCDGPPPPGSRRKTCDKPLCSRHAKHVEGQELDFCPEHQEEPMPRGGPPRHVAETMPLNFHRQDLAAAAEVLARARTRTQGDADHVRGDVRGAAGPDPVPLPPGDRKAEDLPAGPGGGVDPAPPEPPTNSPADVGYLDQEQLAGGAMRPAPSPAPRTCNSCGAPILWAAILAPATDPRDGAIVWVRQRRDDGKGWKCMPVDWQPDPVKGNIVVFRRREAGESQGYVCRVLKKGEAPPPGAKLRTSHFATCKFAERHRRRRDGGRRA